MVQRAEIGGAMPGFDRDRYRVAYEAWSRIEAEYLRQTAAGNLNEDEIDAQMADAHLAFDEALTIVPKSVVELRHYIDMLRARDIRESPASVEVALVTIDQALAQLIADQKAASPAKRVRDLEFALWSLSFVLYEEKCGNSHHWPTRIQEALKRGYSLVHHRGEEFRQLIDETPGAPSLIKKEKGP
uniref:Uncharacterized protein n=1 Tax=Bosea sp. NBC_00436 TaxID=2969620 RepID=A0A9E8CSZ8_9HYPH